MKIVQRIERILSRIEGGLLVLFLTAMVVLTFLQIVLRAFHTYGHFQWANTVVGYLDWADPLGGFSWGFSTHRREQTHQDRRYVRTATHPVASLP